MLTTALSVSLILEKVIKLSSAKRTKWSAVVPGPTDLVNFTTQVDPGSQSERHNKGFTVIEKSSRSDLTVVQGQWPRLACIAVKSLIAPM